MNKTLKEIAGIINGEIVGDEFTVITGVCGIKEARAGDLTFLANSKYTPLMQSTKASAIITSFEITQAPKPIIRTENPSLAFAKMLEFLSPSEIRHPKGIHPSAVLGKDIKLAKDVAIGACAVIADNAEIGNNTVIYAGCYIGYQTKIGENCLIYPNVTIRENIIIGSRVIIHSGTVIGSDGFGFATIGGIHHKIPQVGIVEIQDDVEIGANVAIDRARFEKTVISKGTKIDNLVQIAHNVSVGENSIIVAQTGISGSTTVGRNAVLAGQCGIVGHITIGEGAVIAGQAGVTKSVPANTTVSGYPARLHEEAKRVNACVQRLPRLYELVRRLEDKISQLEEKLKSKGK